jgi:hypothetical protein
MQKEVNERFLKFSSRLPFARDIALGDDITVVINGETYIANCTKIEHFDKQDGTIDIAYVLKFTNE